MANLIIYRIGENAISEYVENCIRIGNSFFSPSKKIIGLNMKKFNIKWTNINITNMKIKVSEIPELELFEGKVVSSKLDIDSIIKTEVRNRFSDIDELSILRKKLVGNLSATIWNEYVDFTENLCNKAENYMKENKIDVNRTV